jgi:hypothetical protein
VYFASSAGLEGFFAFSAFPFSGLSFAAARFASVAPRFFIADLLLNQLGEQ